MSKKRLSAKPVGISGVQNKVKRKNISKGRRYYNEPKLNIKKVLAFIIAIIVIIMVFISVKNLLTKEKKNQEKRKQKWKT